MLEAGHSQRSIQQRLGMTWRAVKQRAEAAAPGRTVHRPVAEPTFCPRWLQALPCRSATKAATSASAPTCTRSAEQFVGVHQRRAADELHHERGSAVVFLGVNGGVHDGVDVPGSRGRQRSEVGHFGVAEKVAVRKVQQPRTVDADDHVVAAEPRSAAGVIICR